MTNSKTSRFRVQAGALVFEIEGTEAFIQQQMAAHNDHIEMILDEQAKLIKSGKIPLEIKRGRKKATGKAKATGVGRRPGRQPVIVRDSKLELKPRQLSGMKKFIETISKGVRLGKDASVFVIAYHLCSDVLKSDTFTAGDVINAFNQAGDNALMPKSDSVDVVQMLRNLAASSIGKEWVTRNPDGTFSLTAKGKSVAEKGEIVRPRGRRPAAPAATAVAKKKPGRRGRPPKKANEKKVAAKKVVAKKKPGRKPGAKKKA